MPRLRCHLTPRLQFYRSKASALTRFLWWREWKLAKEEWDLTYDDYMDASCECCMRSEEANARLYGSCGGERAGEETGEKTGEKTVLFLDYELALLQILFDELRGRHACASCNEMEIDSTPEMNLMVAIVEHDWYETNNVPQEDRLDLCVENGKIRTQDFMVREYFAKKLGLR